MTTTTRDTQRSKVYAAEGNAFRWKWRDVDAVPPTLPRNEDVLAYAQRVARRAVVLRHLPELGRYPIRVPRPNMGQRRALYHGVVAHDGGPFAHELSFPVWARREWIVLHELAHAATWDQGAPHGHEFAAAYLLLVRTMLGRDAERALRDAFKAQRVRYRPPTKRKPLTPEQRAALVARLETARAAKAAS